MVGFEDKVKLLQAANSIFENEPERPKEGEQQSFFEGDDIIEVGNIERVELEKIEEKKPSKASKGLEGLVSKNEKAEEIIEGKIETKAIDNKYLAMDKVSNTIFTNDEYSGKKGGYEDKKIVTSSRKSTKQLSAIVTLDLDNLESTEISIAKNITPYDREVYDAIASLYEGGNSVVSTSMIYRALHIDESGSYVSETARKEIDQIILKLSSTRVKINVEGEMFHYPEIDKIEYEGTLLYVEKLTLTYKGVTSDYYHILRAPILYKYAKLKNQVVTVPKNIVQIRDEKGKRNNKKVTIIQGYLLRAVLTMKRNKQVNRTILLKKLYEHIQKCETNATEWNRKKASIARDISKDVLENWVETGFILGFELVKEKNIFTKINISIPEDHI